VAVSQSYIDNAKNRLAEKMRAVRRDAHRAVGRGAAEMIWQRLADARKQGLMIDADHIVSGFWPIRDEIDIRRLLSGLHDDGVGCALPVVKARDKPLEFRRWRPGDVLEQRAFGLSEPSTAAPVMTPRIVLTPLLAVDPRGNRLGYGGGYYDRTLLQLRQEGQVTAVGVCFDHQRIPDVPHDGGDQKLDWIVTEKGVYRAVR
jgi:5-formyltetrahydrofolate cyclo-ligase